MADEDSGKRRQNSITTGRIKKKTTQGDLRTLLSRPDDYVEPDDDGAGTPTS